MVAERPSPAEARQQTVLVLGPDIPRAASSEGMAFSSDPGTASDAIIISEPIDEATWRALAQGRHALVPIIDFGANKALPADFSAEALTRENVQASLGECQRIWRRVADLPLAELRSSPDVVELSVLALAYSREQPVEAKRTSELRATVSYPLLMNRFGLGSADLRVTLEFLANLNLLKPRFFARAHLCKGCGSSRLCAFEACVNCGSGQISQEVLIHHYRCGHQTRESEFVVQRDLVCPKCRRVLKHFGVDYDKPGVAIRCETCAANMHDPRPVFQCLDCAQMTNADAAETLDWFSYDLTDQGSAAVLEGRLPNLDLARIMKREPRAYAGTDFALLMGEQIRVAKRYKRPISVALVQISNEEAVRTELGVAGASAAYRFVADLMAENLRETDFFTITQGKAILVAFPETDPERTELALARIRSKISQSIAAPVELKAEVRSAEDAAQLIEAQT
jgi:hypothetical protein